MGSTPDAPQTPQFQKTKELQTFKPLNINMIANRQRSENTRVADQNVDYNRLNQTDQFGNSIDWGADGKSVTQRLGGIGRETNEGMRGLQQQYFQGASNFLGNPMDVNREVEDRVYNLGASRLDPRMERSRAALENRLANQGIGIGSEAYKNAMMDYGQQENDAYNSLALQARDQAYRESMGQRQQGIGELQGLAGLGVQYGMQTVNPNFANVPQIGIPGVDLAGLNQLRFNQGLANNQLRMQQDDMNFRRQQQDYENQFRNYQEDLANNSSMLGGLAGLGGTLLTLPMGGGASLGGRLIGGMFR